MVRITDLSEVRLYRKVPNGGDNPNRYRIAKKVGSPIVFNSTGEILTNQTPSWNLFVEGEEHLGSVFLGQWSSIMEKYDVVDEGKQMRHFEGIRQAVIGLENLGDDAVVEVASLQLENADNGWRTVTFSYKAADPVNDQDLWEN